MEKNDKVKMILGILLFVGVFVYGNLKASESTLPEIKMPDSNLTFKMIEGYQDYKIVASHYRTDKKEIRYILANKIGYDALKKKVKVMPEGSKIVKIGWSAKPMTTWPDALEADVLQRVEYMVKDSSVFDADGDHWGYARFVKKDKQYIPYKEGSAECISCHKAVKESDYLFTKFQDTH